MTIFYEYAHLQVVFFPLCTTLVLPIVGTFASGALQNLARENYVVVPVGTGDMALSPAMFAFDIL